MQASKKKIRDECREAKKAAQEKFWKQVDEMIAVQTPGTEIASYLDISPDCLYERCKQQKKMDWSVYSQEKSGKGKAIVRIEQFKKAVKDKNCQMLIHLGKHWLGQTDRQIVETQTVQAPRAILKLPDNKRRSIPKVEDNATP